MKRLEINQWDLAMAFEGGPEEWSYYLDRETGQVIPVTDESRGQWERICAEAYDPESEKEFDLAAMLEDYDLPDWRKETLLEVEQVELGYGTRFVRIPRTETHEAYRDMERFIATVEDEELQDRLWEAIRGRGAFSRFKRVLEAHYRERKRWFAFQDEQQRERMLDWLRFEGIEATLLEPPSREPDPEAPTARELLLAEVLAFVQAAGQLPGVRRIALIGSLATEEPDPKDADLLVTVSDDADLAPLATLGRKLQGHAMSFGRGGEVFLADPRGRYLGRTCPWKTCGPGIRLSCDALHCGRRPYLQDDLQTVKLNKGLIAAPPIELWPAVLARVAVPEDVEGLLRALRER